MMSPWYGRDALGGMSPTADVSPQRHFVLLKTRQIDGASVRRRRRADYVKQL
jgi:hypothetical protein